MEDFFPQPFFGLVSHFGRQAMIFLEHNKFICWLVQIRGQEWKGGPFSSNCLGRGSFVNVVNISVIGQEAFKISVAHFVDGGHPESITATAPLVHRVSVDRLLRIFPFISINNVTICGPPLRSLEFSLHLKGVEQFTQIFPFCHSFTFFGRIWRVRHYWIRDSQSQEDRKRY